VEAFRENGLAGPHIARFLAHQACEPKAVVLDGHTRFMQDKCPCIVVVHCSVLGREGINIGDLAP
jgi:hypothetical protein